MGFAGEWSPPAREVGRSGTALSESGHRFSERWPRRLG